MPIPYNAKPFSNRQYIRDAFKDIDIEVEKEELTQIVQAVRNAMEVVVPGPMKVMRLIEKEVSKAIKNGAQQLIWVTPSGFRVTQNDGIPKGGLLGFNFLENLSYLFFFYKQVN